MLPLGGPHGPHVNICHKVWEGKTRVWRGYPTVKHFENVHSFRQNWQPWHTPGQTNRHCMTAYIALMHGMSRQKSRAMY